MEIRIKPVGLVVAVVAVLSACGGSGSSSPLVITGTAATGLAIPGATINGKCKVGTGTATTLADGSYNLTITNGQLPCVLQITAADGTKLHTVVTGAGRSANANVTPLTEMVVARVLGSDPKTYFAAFDAATVVQKIKPDTIKAAQTDIGLVLTGIVDTSTLGDFISAPLKAATQGNKNSGDVHDQLLDALGRNLDSKQISTLATDLANNKKTDDIKLTVSDIVSCTATTTAGTEERARCSAKVGDLLNVKISDVKPTQPSLGYGEVYYKLGRYSIGKDTINKRFTDWCEANGQIDVASVSSTVTPTIKDPSTFTCTVALGAETPESVGLMKTVVIGPKGVAYLTDGHHTLTAFFETPDGGPDVRVRLRVQANFSDLTESAFWTEMANQKMTWLRDTNDQPITPQQLPTTVGLKNFANDSYRAVLYFARDVGYEQRLANATFLEFYWGKWLRASTTIKLADYNLNDLTSYLALVKKISEEQTAMSPTSIVSEGKTAEQLGQLAAYDSKGEFAKLSKPFTDKKPGKIAYALEYMKTLP
jgi:hypothetical protein